jgi:hypothetical protein
MTRASAARALARTPADRPPRAPDEDGGTLDILPRLEAGDSTYYTDWSIR